MVLARFSLFLTLVNTLWIHPETFHIITNWVRKPLTWILLFHINSNVRWISFRSSLSISVNFLEKLCEKCLRQCRRSVEKGGNSILLY